MYYNTTCFALLLLGIKDKYQNIDDIDNIGISLNPHSSMTTDYSDSSSRIESTLTLTCPSDYSMMSEKELVEWLDQNYPDWYDCTLTELIPTRSPLPTPHITPYKTPYQTPYVTPYNTPYDTPYNTPYITPYDTPYITPYNTPYITPFVTPFKTPSITLVETPIQTPKRTPSISPKSTPRPIYTKTVTVDIEAFTSDNLKNTTLTLKSGLSSQTFYYNEYVYAGLWFAIMERSTTLMLYFHNQKLAIQFDDFNISSYQSPHFTNGLNIFNGIDIYELSPIIINNYTVKSALSIFPMYTRYYNLGISTFTYHSYEP